ncbi:MAG TPA: DUF2628 domain-containing protein [Polyangiaceae bacterium]|nr:DUF2628 domain-containing protein [Polyangiaceae bacterium]
MPTLDLKNPEKFIPRDLFAAFVGPGSDDLLAYYDKAQEKGKPVVASFNLLALLLLPAWLGLRRLWAIWAVYTGLVALLHVVEYVLKVDLPAGAFVGFGVALGFMARGLLLTDANARYLKLKRQKLDSDAIRRALDGRARSSVPLAVAAGLGSVGVIVALGYLVDVGFK